MAEQQLFSAQWSDRGPSVSVSEAVDVERFRIAIAAVVIVWQRANAPHMSAIDVATLIGNTLRDGVGQLELAAKTVTTPRSPIIQLS